MYTKVEASTNAQYKTKILKKIRTSFLGEYEESEVELRGR